MYCSEHMKYGGQIFVSFMQCVVQIVLKCGKALLCPHCDVFIWLPELTAKRIFSSFDF
jgi:hypothetical protein